LPHARPDTAIPRHPLRPTHSDATTEAATEGRKPPSHGRMLLRRFAGKAAAGRWGRRWPWFLRQNTYLWCAVPHGR